jgi:hypothetical protein
VDARKVILNLSLNYKLVLDNASYHNILLEKTPNWTNKHMTEWLAERYISSQIEVFVPTAYALKIAQAKN